MIGFEILMLVLLSLLNGVFALSETAVVSSRRARLQTLVDDGVRGARTALRLADSPGRFLSTVQIGITMVGLVAGAYGGATLGGRFGAWLAGVVPGLGESGRLIGVGVVLVAITYGSIVLGELVPKRLALRNPERMACVVAGPMVLLSRVTAPFVWLLDRSSHVLLRTLGQHREPEQTVTEDEVRTMITEGTETGVFHPAEKELIDGVLRLADHPVRSIMTPRPEVVWLEVDDPPEKVIEDLRTVDHTRYPVARGEIDNLVGVVSSRDLLTTVLAGRPLDLEAAAQPPMVVHDATPILRVLEQMKESRQHLALLVDEYGSIDGLVTVTDILAAIAGDLPDGSWLLNASMSVTDFEQQLALRGLSEAGDFHTMAGFVLYHLGHLPAAGESFEHDGVRYEVVDMDGLRVDKLLVSRKADPA